MNEDLIVLVVCLAILLIALVLWVWSQPVDD